jgi:hypothetical protein
MRDKLSMERNSFQKLTPTPDLNIGIYEEALKYVFENDDVRNVVITGAYGSGKSSMLASYKKLHKDKKYIHISLAHFCSLSNEENLGEEAKFNKTLTESTLEGKIINQLIHKIKASKISRTNFWIKSKESHITTIITTILSTLVFAFSLLLLVICFGTNALKSIVEGLNSQYVVSFFDFLTFGETRLVAGFLLLPICLMVSHSIIRAQKNNRILRKFSIKGVDIELFQEKTDSYFDKYLNELLYLLRGAKVDVIVFKRCNWYNRMYQYWQIKMYHL